MSLDDVKKTYSYRLGFLQGSIDAILKMDLTDAEKIIWIQQTLEESQHE